MQICLVLKKAETQMCISKVWKRQRTRLSLGEVLLRGGSECRTIFAVLEMGLLPTPNNRRYDCRAGSTDVLSAWNAHFDAIYMYMNEKPFRCLFSV